MAAMKICENPKILIFLFYFIVARHIKRIKNIRMKFLTSWDVSKINFIHKKVNSQNIVKKAAIINYEVRRCCHYARWLSHPAELLQSYWEVYEFQWSRWGMGWVWHFWNNYCREHTGWKTLEPHSTCPQINFRSSVASSMATGPNMGEWQRPSCVSWYARTFERHIWWIQI